jgi:hypothetical protein
MANLLISMPFLEVEDEELLASATGVSVAAVGFLSRKRALTALRKEASLKFLPFAAPALATLRKLKIKLRR